MTRSDRWLFGAMGIVFVGGIILRLVAPPGIEELEDTRLFLCGGLLAVALAPVLLRQSAGRPAILRKIPSSVLRSVAKGMLMIGAFLAGIVIGTALSIWI